MLLRVVGQLVVSCARPAWLPPMAQWQSGLVPYRLLLATQTVVLVADVLDCHPTLPAASGVWVQPLPRLGRVVLVWSYLYAGAMVVRYVDQHDTAARPAMVRRHDPDRLSHGAGRLPVDVRASITSRLDLNLLTSRRRDDPLQRRASRAMLYRRPRVS